MTDVTMFELVMLALLLFILRYYIHKPVYA